MSGHLLQTVRFPLMRKPAVCACWGVSPNPSSSQAPYRSQPALQPLSHSFRCASSPYAARFAGPARGPHSCLTARLRDFCEITDTGSLPLLRFFFGRLMRRGLLSENPVNVGFGRQHLLHIVPPLCGNWRRPIFLCQKRGIFRLQALGGGQLFVKALLVKKFLCRLMQQNVGLMLRFETSELSG